MWLSFLAAVVIALLFLYLPGYLAFRALRLPRLLSLCAAPVACVLMLNVAALACDALGVFGNWITIVLPCLALMAIAAFASLALARRKEAPSLEGTALGLFEGGLSWAQCGCYALVGIVATFVVFVSNLGSADSVLQAFDNVFHLATVRSFVESGCCSVFDSRSYIRELVGDGAIPWSASGAKAFYPTGWHLMVALTIGALGVDVPVAINAVNTCLVGVVFPMSTFAFMKMVFADGDQRAVWVGSVCTVAFVAFPWGFLTFGPIYPNVFGNALLPIAMASFMLLFMAKKDAGFSLVVRVALFVVSSAALFIAHSSALFAAVVILAPYLCMVVARACAATRMPGSALIKSVIGYCACALFVCAVWYVLYKTPFMQNGPLADWWPAFIGKVDAMKNVVFLGLKQPYQFALALVVAVGGVVALFKKNQRWLVIAYLISCFIFWIDICTDGNLKRLLAGFWYTDSYRLAALVVMAGIPLSAMGISAICEGIVRLASRVNATAMGGRLPQVGVTIAVVAVFSVFNFCPVNLLGGEVPTTGFGNIETTIRAQNDTSSEDVYGPAEREFVKKVQDLIGYDTLVINQPNDGSAFAFGVDGLDVYYRLLRGYGDDSELDESRLIRHGLVDISKREEVRKAVEFTGAHYVLLLDAGDSVEKKSPYLWTYNDIAPWDGIDPITDDTPGFKVVLSEGDMRLYEIVEVA